MRKYMVLLLAFLMTSMISISTVSAEGSLSAPETWGIYVDDKAGLLSFETKQLIDESSKALNEKTKAQIVVLTVPSLNGVPIEEYGLAVLRSRGIGDKEKNNGLLLLVSKEDRKVRIEVGYGLEGAINDAAAGRILDQYVIPAFKREAYEEGIRAGYQALYARVCEEYKLTAADLPAPASGLLSDEPMKGENASEDEEDDDFDGAFAALGLMLFVGFIWWIVVKVLRGIGIIGYSGGYDSDGASSGSSSDSYGGGSGGGGGSSRDW